MVVVHGTHFHWLCSSSDLPNQHGHHRSITKRPTGHTFAQTANRLSSPHLANMIVAVVGHRFGRLLTIIELHWNVIGMEELNANVQPGMCVISIGGAIS